MRTGTAQHHLVAKAVDEQRLVHFGNTDLGRAACVLEARHRGSARAAGVSGNIDDIGARLSDTDGNRPNSLTRHQLDDHSHPRRLAVVNELREILNRVGVVVRRRRDQFDTRCSATSGGNIHRHLGRGQLTALPAWHPDQS